MTSIEEVIANHRAQVKMNLWYDDPICVVCRKPVENGGDLHEGIVKRGDSAGLRWQQANYETFFSEINCVVLHPKCHAEYGQLPVTREKVILNKINRYGKQAVIDWLNSLTLSEVSLAAIRRLIEQTNTLGMNSISIAPDRMSATVSTYNPYAEYPHEKMVYRVVRAPRKSYDQGLRWYVDLEYWSSTKDDPGEGDWEVWSSGGHVSTPYIEVSEAINWMLAEASDPAADEAA